MSLVLDTIDIYKQNIRIVGVSHFLVKSNCAGATCVSSLQHRQTMSFSQNRPKFLIAIALVAGFCLAPGLFARPAYSGTLVKANGGLGVIKGVVRDQAGSGIADATVAIFRVGTSRLLKQVRSASDGSFFTKILPGTYTVLAVAEGFNSVTLAYVDVSRSAELVYGFNLVRAGSGNTLPERLKDRNSSKWIIRAASAQRTIYQNVEGRSPIHDGGNSAANVDASTEVAGAENSSGRRRGQTVVESYFAGVDKGKYSGVNFATLVPIAENAEVVFAGQISTGANGPSRFESQVRVRPNSKNLIRANSSIGRIGAINAKNRNRSLGQFSVQALDEWTVREGVIVVFGIDYSRFLGAGKDSSISPRLGLQIDLDARTRFRTSYTTQTEQRSWAHAIELEDSQVAFQEPIAIEDLVTVNGHPKLNKTSRLEFGIERVLDSNSSFEATGFLDTTLSRGVGLANVPFDTLEGTGFGNLVANQQGKSQGVRVVYNRRLGSVLSAAAGYSFGSGQRLSGAGLSSPSEIFETGFFQSAYGQMTADFRTGTNVRTIFRLSPQATVFAIDPFQGRLAIYDPSLSVLVTQNLPTLGLPFHAEAILDARNIFDFQTGIATEEGTLRVNSQRRALRGGILVRF